MTTSQALPSVDSEKICGYSNIINKTAENENIRKGGTRHMCSVKQKYIEAAYEMICDVGYENISIRSLARKLGCNSAILYRHFHSLNYLLMVASVRFLRPYHEALQALSSNIPSSLDLNLQGWECLAYYGFQNIPIYQNLFLEDPDLRAQAFDEYFNEYPEELKYMKGYLTDALTEADLLKRDHLLLESAVIQGQIASDSVEYLANSDLYILRGMFQYYRDSYKEPGIAHKATLEFINLLYHNYKSQLLPGQKLYTQRFE